MPRLIFHRNILMFALAVLFIPIALQLTGNAEKPDVTPVHQVIEEKQDTDIAVLYDEENTEPEEQADTKPVEQVSADPRVNLINSVELTPVKPQSEDLDYLLDNIMDNIVEEDMSTYEKTKASYDYLVNNVSYGSHISRMGTPVGSVTCGQIASNYGSIEGYGAVVLSSNVGMCNAYSSAFILMAREIGLEARLVKGSTRRAGGGYTYHEWAEVIIDGVPYVFDPQLEQDLTRAGLGTYNVFFKTYDQIPGRYSKHSAYSL